MKWRVKDLASLYTVGKFMKQHHPLLLQLLVSSNVDQCFVSSSSLLYLECNTQPRHSRKKP